MKKTCLLFLSMCLLAAGSSFGQVLLNETWADADRTDTDLPNESAFYVDRPDNVTMSTGKLSYDVSGSSEKLWTYFTANGSPAAIGVGQQLVTTIKFTPTGLYDTDKESFRFGLFNDPTNDQILEDTNSDGGPDGEWTDSTGYAVQLCLSNGTTKSDNPYIGKRTDLANSSLLGSSGAYDWVNDSSGANIVATSGSLITLEFILDRVGVDEMLATFTISDGTGVLSTLQMTDSSGIYTSFDQLFFRLSKDVETCDVLDLQEIKVELVPEPASLLLLGLGGLAAIRRKR